MVTYDFDEILERRSTHSVKWSAFDEDVLPLWVADMDFRSPQPVLDALRKRADEGHFGYTFHIPELGEVLCNRMKQLYDWEITPEDIIYPPGLVYGLNLVAQTVGKAGDAILMHTPVYGPFLNAPGNNGRFAQMIPLRTVQDDAATFHYEIDFEAFEAAAAHKQASLFYLCNPHNPGGHIHTREELLRLAEICLKHDVMICSDEIHCDLLLEEKRHIPIASLSPEIAQRTITMMAPSKTFNLAGLGCSVVIVQNEALRKKVAANMWQMGIHTNIMGYTAALAAYRDGEEWLKQLLPYLHDNRDWAVQYIRENMPGLKMMIPEATHLLWIDCRDVISSSSAAEFFLKEGRVAVNDGTFFEPNGTGFIRLNFACPRSILMEALERLKNALAKAPASANGREAAPG